jgi:hypothetical protein
VFIVTIIPAFITTSIKDVVMNGETIVMINILTSQEVRGKESYKQILTSARLGRSFDGQSFDLDCDNISDI